MIGECHNVFPKDGSKKKCKNRYLGTFATILVLSLK